jgi:hypothetical protein
MRCGHPPATLDGSRAESALCTKCLVVALAGCSLSVTANVRTKGRRPLALACDIVTKLSASHRGSVELGRHSVRALLVLAVLPDGRVASGGEDGVLVWDMQNGTARSFNRPTMCCTGRSRARQTCSAWMICRPEPGSTDSCRSAQTKNAAGQHVPAEALVKLCTKRFRGNAGYVATGAITIQADALSAIDGCVIGAGR